MSAQQTQFEDTALKLTPLLQEEYQRILTQSQSLEEDAVLGTFSSLLDPWLAEQGDRRAPDAWEAWQDWIETKLKPGLRRMGPKAQQALDALQDNLDPSTESQIIALAVAISILLQIEQPTPSNLLLIALALIRRKNRE